MIIPPLKIKIMLESNPLKSIMLVGRFAVLLSVNKQHFSRELRHPRNGSFRSIESGAGERFLPLDCRERACAKGVFFLTETGVVMMTSPKVVSRVAMHHIPHAVTYHIPCYAHREAFTTRYHTPNTHVPCIMDFKDTVYPFSESHTLFLDFFVVLFCVFFFMNLFNDFSNRGMSKQYPLTVLFESPNVCICVRSVIRYAKPTPRKRFRPRCSK